MPANGSDQRRKATERLRPVQAKGAEAIRRISSLAFTASGAARYWRRAGTRSAAGAILGR